MNASKGTDIPSCERRSRHQELCTIYTERIDMAYSDLNYVAPKVLKHVFGMTDAKFNNLAVTGGCSSSSVSIRSLLFLWTPLLLSIRSVRI